MDKINLKDNIKINDGVMFIKGNVKILNDKGDVILDKDNAISNYFRKKIMYFLWREISTNINNTNVSITEQDVDFGYISNIYFGKGMASAIGAKASKDDEELLNKLPIYIDEGNETPLYIHSSINSNLSINFNTETLSIRLESELYNNDNKTYIIGELGLFDSENKMLTHMFFDPILFEPDSVKTVIYTIYFY